MKRWLLVYLPGVLLGALAGAAMALLEGAVIALSVGGCLALLAWTIGASVTTAAMSGVYIGGGLAVVSWIYRMAAVLKKIGELEQAVALKQIEKQLEEA